MSYTLLGSVKLPGDECPAGTHTFTLDLHSGEGRDIECVTGPDSKTVLKTTSATVTNIAPITSELAKLEVVELPTTCGYDGPSLALSLTGTVATPSTYLDDDYNCLHRTDVGYVSPNLSALHTAIAKAFGIQ